MNLANLIKRRRGAITTPLAPLAPIDLTDRTTVTAVLDVVAKIGEVLISAGATNADAGLQMRYVAESFGVFNSHVDITYTRMRLFAKVQDNPGKPVAVVRIIGSPRQDFSALRDVDKLIRDIRLGKVGLFESDAIVTDILTTPPSLPLWRVVTAWAIMAAGVSLILNGTILVAITSFAATASIVFLNLKFETFGLPLFFRNIVGGVIAAVLASAAYRIGSTFDVTILPSTVIATSIVALLAGLTLVQSIQNGVTHAPVTASARLFDVMIATGGIVAGVAIGIELSAMAGYLLPPISAVPSSLSSYTLQVAGGTIASAAFARACYGDWPTVAVSGLTSFAGTSLCYFFFIPYGLDSLVATSLTAVFIGLLGGILGRKFHIPPLIVAIAGVTPHLPGLTIYRGMYGLLHDQILIGFGNLTLAYAIATAISAGIIFGEWGANKLKHPRTIMWKIAQWRAKTISTMPVS